MTRGGGWVKQFFFCIFFLEMLKYFYFLTFFCAVFLCLINYPVLAASGLGIGVSPVKIEDVVDPGQVLQKEIRVTNNSSSAITFYAYLENLKTSFGKILWVLVDIRQN